MNNTLKFPNDPKDKLFFTELQKKVNAYFKLNHCTKTGNSFLKLKAITLLLSYIILYLLTLRVQSIQCYILLQAILGILTISLALNVAHDAAHGTFSSSANWNKLMLYTFDLLGANGYLWKMKHVHSHHPHVNIPNMDGDIKQSNLVRIFPNASFKSFHKYQYLYMPVFYLCYTLVWLFFRDFRDILSSNISGKPGFKHSKRAVLFLIFGKLLYLIRIIVLPYILLPFSFGQILLGFVALHFASSVTVALALISAHVGEDSIYPEPDEKGMMPFSYVRHQIITTVDFSTSNSFLTHLFGGFNHHVVHHLFPKISHIHYPVITEILKEVCAKHKIPYKSNPTLWKAICSHFNFLKMRSANNLAVEYLEM